MIVYFRRHQLDVYGNIVPAGVCGDHIISYTGDRFVRFLSIGQEFFYLMGKAFGFPHKIKKLREDAVLSGRNMRITHFYGIRNKKK